IFSLMKEYDRRTKTFETQINNAIVRTLRQVREEDKKKQERQERRRATFDRVFGEHLGILNPTDQKIITDFYLRLITSQDTATERGRTDEHIRQVRHRLLEYMESYSKKRRPQETRDREKA